MFVTSNEQGLTDLIKGDVVDIKYVIKCKNIIN